MQPETLATQHAQGPWFQPQLCKNKNKENSHPKQIIKYSPRPQLEWTKASA